MMCSTLSDSFPVLTDLRESASETSCALASFRASIRVSTRLPTPAMSRTTATRPTMASIRRRRIDQPNR